jgi:hypothetical protein
MIEDDDANFMCYTRDKLLTGNELFGTYINKVFPLKQNDVEGAKPVLSTLWGALIQCNKTKQYVKIDNGFDIPDNHDILTLLPSSTEKDYANVKTVLKSNRFMFNYGRIKCFMLSQGRSKISKLSEKYIDYIVKTHTDSMYMTFKPVDIVIGNDIGELKFDGYCPNYYIKNINTCFGKLVK